MALYYLNPLMRNWFTIARTDDDARVFAECKPTVWARTDDDGRVTESKGEFPTDCLNMLCLLVGAEFRDALARDRKKQREARKAASTQPTV